MVTYIWLKNLKLSLERELICGLTWNPHSMCPARNFKKMISLLKKKIKDPVNIHTHCFAFCQDSHSSLSSSIDHICCVWWGLWILSRTDCMCISESRNKWPVCEEEFTQWRKQCIRRDPVNGLHSRAESLVCVVETHCIDIIHTKSTFQNANTVNMRRDHVKDLLAVGKFPVMRPQKSHSYYTHSKLWCCTT